MTAKIRMQKSICIIIILLCLYVSDDIFVFSIMEGKLSSVCKPIVIVLCCLVLCFIWFKRGAKIRCNKDSCSFLFLSITMILTMFLHGDFRLGYLYIVMIFLTGYLLHYLFGTELVLEILYKSVIVISVLSLIFFVPVFFKHSLADIFPVVRTYTGAEFSLIGLNILPVHHSHFIRNYGPFREPGVFQMYLILSLVFGLFYKREQDWKKTIVLVLALLTTFSTTGYIALFMLMGGFWICNNKETKETKRVLAFLLVLTFSYMALFTDFLYKEGYGSVFGKLSSANNSISLAARIASIKYNFLIFLENPFLGKGITYESEAFNSLTLSAYGVIKSNTNTIMIQLARFGLLYGIVYTYRNINYVIECVKKNRIAIVMVAMSVICIYVGEDITYSMITSIILFCQFPKGKCSNRIVGEI